jgi:hypothetical protein
MITLPHMIGQHFAYAAGRLGTLEDQLLKQTDLDRLLGASSGKEAVKMLRDIEFVASPEADESFQETLSATAALLKENVERMVPEEKCFIFDILWIEGDRPKIAFDLKKKHGFTSGIATEPLPPVSARFSPELSGPFDSPSAIDDAVAAACEKEMQRIAAMSGSSAIHVYVLHILCVYHTHSAIRNGTQKSDLETILLLQEAVASLREMLDDMRHMVLGPEPVFSYAARAMNHVALLKVLLTGKVNNLPIQEVKSLLPPLL